MDVTIQKEDVRAVNARQSLTKGLIVLLALAGSVSVTVKKLNYYFQNIETIKFTWFRELLFSVAESKEAPPI
ncbi:MAG TPA: hypothetical protein VGG71_12140 [Chitinophagaceae bacterium]|jgi:hypothetical protein